MFGLKSWWRRRIVSRHPIDDRLWQRTIDAVPFLRSLDGARRAELRRLATLFLHDKDFYGAASLQLDDEMATIIAAQACVPVLELGYDWLSGWHSIYVYPGQFRTRRTYRDQIGLEQQDMRELSGEAHYSGGMVLSWQDVIDDIEIADDGQNVIIHEIAHKLDMKNGDADGYPPLHAGMSHRRWVEAMQAAFDDLNRQVERGLEPEIDPYAATDPAEFFAVMSEYYFELPGVIGDCYPDVLEQLAAFYRGEGTAS